MEEGETGTKLIDMRFLFGVMKMFWNQTVVIVVQNSEYTKNK